MLRVEDVTKSYGSTRALRGLSFHVPRGSIFSLLGPNGAGKSTMVRILTDIVRADSGTVAFQMEEGGPEVAKIPLRSLGYLPEERGLYLDAKVSRTIEYLGRLRGMRREEARRAGAEWLERFDLSDRADEPVKALSKGNQQKIQFAVSVLHRPPLAILDEPFSGLDPLNQDLFCDLLRELCAQGTTILLSAHQLALVERLADEVLVLAQGRAVLEGPMEEVMKAQALAPRLRVTTSVEAPEPPPSAGIASVSRADEGVLVVDLVSAASLGPALEWIGRHLAPTELHTETPDLHSLYVQAVAGEEGTS